MGGTPVFVGTRVPFRALIDYLEAGHDLDEFLVDFPSVPRDLAIAGLEAANNAQTDRARFELLVAAMQQVHHGEMSALPQEILNLSVEERLRLVDDLWESIRQHPESLPITDDQREELDRRLEEHRSDPAAAEPLSSVLERIRSRN